MAPPSVSSDTIAAIASPPGRGAVGVIRLSGAEVPRIAEAILGAIPPARVARLSRFLDRDGGTLDTGLAFYFPAPASFTGEHVLELQGHGGALVVDMLMQRALALGCRQARPGEFSERAFLNGKMDVAQAEAVADLIDASTRAAARAAVRSMQGEFSTQIRLLQTLLIELRVHTEAAIDFPDEDIDLLTGPAISGRVSRVFDAFLAIEAAARQGSLLRDGLTVVIAGKPNAGKSSLLNRLVGDDVAIVTEIPGTTRDLLRQHVHLDGLPLNLVDTAGLRTAGDIVEAEGIRRAKAEMLKADRVLYVVDASADRAARTGGGEHPANATILSAEDRELLPPDVPVTLVLNKIDLVGMVAGIFEGDRVSRLCVSALTGDGVDLLREHLKVTAGYRDTESGGFSARRRHLDALQRAHEFFRNAADSLSVNNAVELFAEDLRLAQRALGEITGEFTSEDLLGEIFGGFCIGK